jgi:hypothetical protein
MSGTLVKGRGDAPIPQTGKKKPVQIIVSGL